MAPLVDTTVEEVQGKMTIGASAVQIGYDVTNRSFTVGPSTAVQSSSSPQTGAATKPAGGAEDTVQLSSSAQQYLQDAQKHSEQIRDTVAQLVRAAAAGDTAALSLLTVV